MGGFRHYIKTPLILLSGDNTVILPVYNLHTFSLPPRGRWQRISVDGGSLLLFTPSVSFADSSLKEGAKLIRYRFNIIKLWNTNYVFYVFIGFCFYRVCINTCSANCINRIVKGVYKNSYIFESA